ncbi:hypothetical protein CON65_11000 [Bacillus pseudomycoides]|uniref:Uncharacterized protein n=2 Tax=Bacillaceae TaxID=186817 RepID=A0AA91ZTI2_9BACI|nr:hypothetical protein COO03_16850 [Bacillus sp. AFS098217]PED82629.1 hypothetical protein CON65_11000 [Bacillus pseudomycoides]PEU12081.1 hypothetical protein CN525_21370 [Bacillus sp. AFS014408]PEU17735.1 hypothetical protein CN524_01545 [Bacillus sp. AFS019443]PFW60889.1 hypothetical protein COL20_19950 [Bacillus sp. AFS075034]
MAGGENMKKQKKKRTKFRWLIWISVISISLAIFLGTLGLHMERWHHEKREAFAVEHSGQASYSKDERHHIKQENFENGKPVQHYEKHHEKHHEEKFDGIFLILFTIELSSILLGWFILKKAKGQMIRKWIGILLIIIGVLPLLPLFAVVVFPIWLYKKRKQNSLQSTTDYTMDSYLVLSNNKADILDQWEKQIRKEEK